MLLDLVKPRVFLETSKPFSKYIIQVIEEGMTLLTIPLQQKWQTEWLSLILMLLEPRRVFFIIYSQTYMRKNKNKKVKEKPQKGKYKGKDIRKRKRK